MPPRRVAIRQQLIRRARRGQQNNSRVLDFAGLEHMSAAIRPLVVAPGREEVPNATLRRVTSIQRSPIGRLGRLIRPVV